MMITRIFLNHPESVNETYVQHAGVAGGFAVRLLCAGFAAGVHAVFPFLFEKTTSQIIEKLYEQTQKR